MEQNPSAPSRSHAWSWSTKGSKGILLPMELELKTHAVNQLPYNLGVLFTNTRQSDLMKGCPAGRAPAIRRAIAATIAPGSCIPVSTSR